MIRESSRPPHAAAVVVLPNHLHCTGIVANDVGTLFERWQCWLQRWGWVGRGGWHGWNGWVHFCCCQPPDPIVNPFHWTLASPLHAVRAPALPCKPILPSVQMILVGGMSMLHDPGYGPGGWSRVEVGGGWVAVSLIRAPNDFCLPTHNPTWP